MTFIDLRLNEREARALLATADFGKHVTDALRTGPPEPDDTPQKLAMAKLAAAIERRVKHDTRPHPAPIDVGLAP